MAEISNPNIGKYYAVKTPDGREFYAIRFSDGPQGQFRFAELNDSGNQIKVGLTEFPPGETMLTEVRRVIRFEPVT